MPEVMEVKDGQASPPTGCLKGMPGIIPAMLRCIVKHPRHIAPGPQTAE